MSVFSPALVSVSGVYYLTRPGPQGLAHPLAKYETQTDDSGQAKSEKYSSTDSALQPLISEYNQL